MELKEQLRAMRSMEAKQLTSMGLDELINRMLSNIGSVDSELRDELIYPSFVRLISENFLDEQQQRIFSQHV